MSVKIGLTIINQNDADYPAVILRKFFNMIFVNADGKTLDIYTAIVFTGTKETSLITGTNSLPIPFCMGKSKNPCKIKFSYTVKKDGKNLDYPGNVKGLEFMNMTDRLFCQKKCVENVWGNCTAIGTQKEVESKLKSLYPTLASPTGLPDVSKPPVWYIDEKEKGSTHVFLASGSKFSCTENSYTLSGGECSGVEATSWVKTTLTLPKGVSPILDKQICFTVEFKGTFFTPDFTWYFAPPTNYVVDKDLSEVVCDKRHEKNLFSDLSGDTTITFEEWTRDQDISSRKMTRVQFQLLITAEQTGLSDKLFEIKTAFCNPSEHANMQFILGLVVAFLMSFCSDKTRLNDYLRCVQKFCTCGKNCVCGNVVNALGFFFPILIILAFLSIVFRRKVCMPLQLEVKHRFLLFCKWAGLAATILLSIYVFIVWLVLPVGTLQGFFHFLLEQVHFTVPVCEMNRNIIVGLITIGLVGNAVYLIYHIGYKKRRMIDYF